MNEQLKVKQNIHAHKRLNAVTKPNKKGTYTNTVSYRI